MQLPSKLAGMHWRTYDRLMSQFMEGDVEGLGRMAGKVGADGQRVGKAGPVNLITFQK